MKPFLSRRSFIEDSILSMTALGAAAYADTAAAQEQKDEKKPEKKRGPNDRIGIAIIGSGGRSGGHIGYYKNDARTIIRYVVDPDSNRISDKLLDSIAASQGGVRPQRAADLRKALEDKNVDAISCASTNHWHTLTGIWALQAGKHAYIEKPISHNVHEGLAITAAAKKYKLVVQTGTQCRSNPANIEAVAFTQRGGIGEVNFARGIVYGRRKAIGPLGEYKIPESVDQDLWFGPATVAPLTRPNFHYDWHWQRLYGNGNIGNQGPHQTDIARWHLGLNRYPNSIITYGGRLGYEAETKNPNYKDAGDTANTEVAIFDFGEKCIVFEVRGLETKPLPFPAGKGSVSSAAVLVYGSSGFLVQVHYGYSAAYDLEGNLIREFKGGDDKLHYRNFIDAVEKNSPVLAAAPAEVGAISAGLSHLGNISYYLGDTGEGSASRSNNRRRSAKQEAHHVSPAELKGVLKKIKSLDDNGATVDRTVEHLQANGVDLAKTPLTLGPFLEFDTVKKTFKNNPAADALLTREYRSPYIVPKPEEV
ncbi:MAG: Gfo/Idh/MocA family oxidoreductase [Planctomycetaceae bacterium]|jgi:predicted dehydrogenase|nr:Gfo/Idh/MocA family oxidoreductase [Planctomycetaceae bacterium]